LETFEYSGVYNVERWIVEQNPPVSRGFLDDPHVRGICYRCTFHATGFILQLYNSGRYEQVTMLPTCNLPI
jgi:hypothetical protein